MVSQKQVERIRLTGTDAPVLFKQTVEYLEGEQVPIKEVNVTESAAGEEHCNASFVVSGQNVIGWEQI